jgi:hypothetical protein
MMCARVAIAARSATPFRSARAWLAAGALGLAVAATPLVAQQQPAGGRDVAGTPQQQGQMQQGQQQQGQTQQGEETLKLNQIARFIGQDTKGIVHVHLSQVNLDNLQSFVGGTLQRSQLNEDVRAGADQQMQNMHATARNWIDQLKSAGAEDLFVLVHAQGQQLQPIVIVPASDNAQADQIARLLTPPQGQQGQMQATKIGDAVILASQQQIQQFQGAAAGNDQAVQNLSTLPFATALNEVSEASVHAAVMPTPQMQQAFSALTGGHMVQPAGDDVNFDKAVKWMAIGIDYPGQDQAIQVVLQANDEQSAQKLEQGITQQLAKARQSDAVQENAPQLASDKQLLQPQREGDQVTLSLSNEEASKILARALQAQVGGQGQGQGQQAQPTQAQPQPQPAR